MERDPRHWMVVLAQRIREMTGAYESGELLEDELPCSQDLAREFSLKHDLVKKKLKVLLRAGVIQAISYSPKRYKFDHYMALSLEDDSDETLMDYLGEAQSS